MDFIYDPSLVLYLPLWKLDGASFVSKDAYGHSCTVTGALWRPKGRYFDGTDDAIRCGSSSSIDDIFDGGGTLMAWINPASDGELNNGRILTKYTTNLGWTLSTKLDDGSGVVVRCYYYWSGNDGDWALTNRDITLNVWSLVAFTLNADTAGNTPLIYVNGDSKAVTETTASTGTRATDAAQILAIGNNPADTNNTFDGLIGEVMLYNRILTPQEIQNIYLATKWRYR